MLKGRNFITTQDFTKKELEHLIELAIDMKHNPDRDIRGKTLAMLFFNPSLRTRTSFSVAMFQLGGYSIDLSPGDKAYTFEFGDGAIMDGKTIEHVKEAAGVLSRYCDAIAIRSSELVTTSSETKSIKSWTELKKDKVINSFAKYSTVPVINMESNMYHPCQALGDAVTMKEHCKDLRCLKYLLTWAYHPKPLPVATPNSQLLLPTKLGMDVTLLHPRGWELDNEIIKAAKNNTKESGGSFEITNDFKKGFSNVDVVCTKSWGSLQYYGKWDEEKKLKDKLKHWVVDSDKMELTNNAKFMHCLPVRRNVVVTDDVIDSKNSVVVDQAENRLHTQKALLYSLLG